MRFTITHRIGTLVAIACVALLACSDDSAPPRDLGGGPGTNGGSSSSGDDDAGGDADADAEDADTDAEDADTDPETCELTPPESGDNQYLCCFEDEDCEDAQVAAPEELRCYHATCEEGGHGTCRRPPPDPGIDCWDDSECDDGQECDFEPGFECTDPGFEETPGACVDADD